VEWRGEEKTRVERRGEERSGEDRRAEERKRGREGKYLSKECACELTKGVTASCSAVSCVKTVRTISTTLAPSSLYQHVTVNMRARVTPAEAVRSEEVLGRHGRSSARSAKQHLDSLSHGEGYARETALILVALLQQTLR